jgi:hypothetical protein
VTGETMTQSDENIKQKIDFDPWHKTKYSKSLRLLLHAELIPLALPSKEVSYERKKVRSI